MSRVGRWGCSFGGGVKYRGERGWVTDLGLGLWLLGVGLWLQDYVVDPWLGGCNCRGGAHSSRIGGVAAPGVGSNPGQISR